MDAAGVIGEEYRLGPEDVLEITVQGEDKLKTRQLVTSMVGSPFRWLVRCERREEPPARWSGS